MHAVPATVLVVHDVPDYLDILASLLQSAGYHVLRAADGSTALGAAERHRPELVICPVYGVSLCRALRADTRLRRTPVLLVSGYYPEQDGVLEALRAGADDYLLIPHNPMRLIAKATTLIRQRRETTDHMAPQGEKIAGVAHRGEFRGAETALVVDADKVVRAAARRVLRARGYAVIEAPDAAAAIAACEGTKRHIDLLSTDVMMSEMSGPALAEAVRQARPYLKVLYMAGYTDDIARRYNGAGGGIGVLQKPFADAELAAAVRNVLRQES
jgi:DNA-binding response OmpR family regulator